MSKTFAIDSNTDSQSLETARKLRELLCDIPGFRESDNPRYVFAIGGDGKLLGTVSKYGFNPKCVFAGINTGFHGFLQEFSPTQLDLLVQTLKHGRLARQRVSFLSCDVGENREPVNCLNEIIIRGQDIQDMKPVCLDIQVNNGRLQHFRGDGVMVCTSVGSTGHNLPYNGSIVPADMMDTLQITPMGPLYAYNTLHNSIIYPKGVKIKMIPEARTESLVINTDGVYRKDLSDIKTLTISLDKRKLCRLRPLNHTITDRVSEKLLLGCHQKR